MDYSHFIWLQNTPHNCVRVYTYMKHFLKKDHLKTFRTGRTFRMFFYFYAEAHTHTHTCTHTDTHTKRHYGLNMFEVR